MLFAAEAPTELFVLFMMLAPLAERQTHFRFWSESLWLLVDLRRTNYNPTCKQHARLHEFMCARSQADRQAQNLPYANALCGHILSPTHA